MSLRPARGLRPIQRISRRGLISSGMFAGLLLASGMPVSAGGRGGVLRLAVPGASVHDSWDPKGHHGLFMQVVGQGAVYDCLTEITASGELSGELAESWDGDETARRWIFTLRDGLMFHDGQPVRPEDVVASFRHHALPEVARVRLDGSKSVVFELSEGNADFPFRVAGAQLTVAPEGDFSRGIGSGLYRVAIFEPGHFARLERVSAHWKDGQAGWFDAVEVQAIGESVSPDLLQLGRLHALGDLRQEQAENLEAAQLLVTLGYRKWVAAVPAGWQEQRARLSRALPRGVLAGPHGVISSDHPLSHQHLYAQSFGPQEDPAEMAALLGEGFDPALLMWERFDGAVTAGETLARAFEGPLKDLSQDDEIKQMFLEARASFNTARRAELYGALQAQIAARGSALWPATVPIWDAHVSALAHGAQVSALLPLDGARIAERWWFA